MNEIKIIMYHFVRELDLTRYPHIKARRLGEFKDQLNYLEKKHEFVTLEDCIEVLNGKGNLPKDATLLTFDDGYKDHFENVFPILEEKNIQGCFFPPAKAVLKDEVLDVNKIHHILAVNEENKNIDGLVKKIFDLLDKHRKEFSLKSNEEYYSEFAKEGHYDNEKVIFIKRLLQKGLVKEARIKIVNELFKKYIHVEEDVLSNELYMNMDQLRCMQRNGMHIGSHGYDHYWLDTLSEEEVMTEIDKSIEFLDDLRVSEKEWTFCYPYGAYNDKISELLQERGFRLGFTTRSGVADIDEHSAMKLPRVDTNEIPFKVS